MMESISSLPILLKVSIPTAMVLDNADTDDDNDPDAQED